MPRTIELTPEEVTARTVRCGDCRAPSGTACQSLSWNKGMPTLVPRQHHPRRLKFAKKLARKATS